MREGEMGVLLTLEYLKVGEGLLQLVSESTDDGPGVLVTVIVAGHGSI